MIRQTLIILLLTQWRSIMSIYVLYNPRTQDAPLFPYTSLFRSPHTTQIAWSLSTISAMASSAGMGPKGRPRKSMSALLDRKSTRLNSSHVAISYAVFCLKKKTLMYLCVGQNKADILTEASGQRA